MNFLKENSAEPPAAEEVPLRSILELSNTTISAAERGLEVTMVEEEMGDFLAFFFVVVVAVVVAEDVAENEDEEGVMRERKSRSCSGMSSVVVSAFRFFDPAPVAPVAPVTLVVVAVLGLKMVLTSFFFLRGAGAATALAAAFLSITRSMLCCFRSR